MCIFSQNRLYFFSFSAKGCIQPFSGYNQVYKAFLPLSIFSQGVVSCLLGRLLEGLFSCKSSFIDSQNGLGWKRPFKVTLPNPACNEQGHLRLDPVTQSHIQTDPQCFQGQVNHSISGQSVSVFHQPHC